MGVYIVVGGQYGGEGKGKVSYELVKRNKIQNIIRVGGTNSGHTVVIDNKKSILRQLPTASFLADRVSILPAGSYIDLDILQKELTLTDSYKRLKIDPNAIIITKNHIISEKKHNLKDKIGSTLSGTGEAVLERIKRPQDVLLAKDVLELKEFIVDTKEFCFNELKNGNGILIEGTQGFGLSLLHSPFYPYTTSRDTTASGFLSEVGLSPFDVKEIIMCIRSYPIRVEGNSGPLKNETNWKDIGVAFEYSSVSKKVRRVAKFDADIVKKAIIVSKPSKIVLNHLDYIHKSQRINFIKQVEQAIGQKIDYVGLSNKILRDIDGFIGK